MASVDQDPCRGINKNESDKFALNSDGKTVVRVADDDLLKAVKSNPLSTVQWDAFQVTYNALTDVVEYYQGGLGGTLVLTFTATYQTNRKKNLVSGVWT